MSWDFDFRQTRIYQEALDEGRQEGRQEERQKLLDEKEAIACRLIEKGTMPLEDIAEATGLPIAQVRKLKKSKK